jgi:hypothetical protein
MGGIGKTQMATEYIYRHSQDYDLIWWIEAARVTQIRASLTDLARQLGLPGAFGSNTAVPAVREALRLGRPFRRWLLVFDAAESPEEVLPFIPTNGPGEVLITSRNPDWAGVARPLEVAVFERGESIELLGKRGPDIDVGDANRLAEMLGDLPLAVEQAAAWRAMTGRPVAEYLRLFDESVTEILDTSAPPAYEVSVAATWNVSFDELKVEQNTLQSESLASIRHSRSIQSTELSKRRASIPTVSAPTSAFPGVEPVSIPNAPRSPQPHRGEGNNPPQVWGESRCEIPISQAGKSCWIRFASGCSNRTPMRSSLRRCTAWAASARPRRSSSTSTGTRRSTTSSGGSRQSIPLR